MFLLQWFRDEVAKEEPEECSILLSLIAPLAQAHGLLIRDLEQRMHGWEGKGGPKAASGKIADVLLAHLPPLLPVSTAPIASNTRSRINLIIFLIYRYTKNT